jgi:NitT/TauT family transport system substrate-binding protein
MFFTLVRTGAARVRAALGAGSGTACQEGCRIGCDHGRCCAHDCRRDSTAVIHRRSALQRIAMAAVAAIACTALTMPSKASAQAKPELASVTLGLPVTTSTLLPLYLADEEGYFRKEGVDVKLVAFRGGSSMVMAVVSGSVQMGVGALSSVTVGIDAGQDLQVFYGGFNMAIFDWYAVPRIKTFKDARGTRIGVSAYGSSTDFLTRYALKLNGIDSRTGARIIQGGASAGRIAAMDSGQLDVNIFAPPETDVAQDRGYHVVLHQTDIAPDYPFHVFFASRSFLQKNPNTVRAVLRGFVLGKRDKARSIKTLISRVGIDPKYAARTYDEILKGMYEDGRLPTEAGMNAFFDSGIEAGVFKERWPTARYWNGQFQQTYGQWKP